MAASSLHFAAFKGDLPTCEAFLNSGVDVNSRADKVSISTHFETVSESICVSHVVFALPF